MVNLLHFRHAPLGVHSAKRRHQSPEWMILSHVSCFIQERLLDFRSCWKVFIHVVRERPGGLLQFSKGKAVKIFLASVSSGIRAVWPNKFRIKCKPKTSKHGKTPCLDDSREMLNDRIKRTVLKNEKLQYRNRRATNKEVVF